MPIDVDNTFANLYNTVCSENNAIQTTIQNMKNTFSTDESKQMYQSTEVSNLNYVNGILFYIFFFLVILLISILLKQNVSMTYKIIIVLLVIIYPFVIYPIEYGINNVLLYIWAVINGNVYAMSDY